VTVYVKVGKEEDEHI